jgi:hypothetical protein
MMRNVQLQGFVVSGGSVLMWRSRDKGHGTGIVIAAGLQRSVLLCRLPWMLL